MSNQVSTKSDHGHVNLESVERMQKKTQKNRSNSHLHCKASSSRPLLHVSSFSLVEGSATAQVIVMTTTILPHSTMPRRGVAVNADEFFAYVPHRPAPPPPSSSAPRHAQKLQPTNPSRRANFVTANYTFAVAPDAVFAHDDPDVLDWGAVDVVFQPSSTPDCPICLYPCATPRITRCGHVLDHTCALQLLFHAGDSVARCPLCSDGVRARDLKAVVFLGRDEVVVGGGVRMRLVARPRYSVVPRLFDVRDFVRDFERLRRVVAGEAFFSRLVVADTEFLLDLAKKSVRDLEALLREDVSLTPFVRDAKAVVKEEKDRLKLRRRIGRRESGEGTESLAGGSGLEQDSRPDCKIDDGPSSSNGPAIYAEEISTPSGKQPGPKNRTECCKTTRAAGGPTAWPPSDALAHSSPGMYVFFQAADGQHVYLHPLCHRIVSAEFGSDYTRCPNVLDLSVIQIDRLTMDEVLRKRYRFLGHLPLGCEFSFVEVSLRSICHSETLERFSAEIAERSAGRRRRKVASDKESKRIARQETKQLRSYFQISDEVRQRQAQREVDSTDLASFPAMPFRPLAPADAAAASTTAVSTEAQQWGAAVSSYSAATSNMGVFPSLSSVVTPDAPATADGNILAGEMTGGRRGILPPLSVSPPKGAWGESPPRAQGAWGESPPSGEESTRSIGMPRNARGRGRKQITVLSTAGANHRR